MEIKIVLYTERLANVGVARNQNLDTLKDDIANDLWDSYPEADIYISIKNNVSGYGDGVKVFNNEGCEEAAGLIDKIDNIVDQSIGRWIQSNCS